ncbi:nicotinate-nucleotide--dimethylbenzimidazole phosphoribosyltransferase [Halodesulfovibrio sp. MK-HDV]|uniref:nicotinate-nucleotide--dimethylbenzimidazole phosphoribosyltransferase n=1 Tax=Halodesulfovibrio sp. MK-HDV TaxID=2599925 RepID=UPI00136E44FC|nr:nicotinate-nucleotide--dimethylbenzimidazole phosphoribosyltransferase [Halodesulfovibrio sp. MK-HDV]KAF1076606.1 Nicotinate-nucleotide--dimethylbenzimidazole phosphoribosyltransferase [Halodesulfovibrio sp. MK-HDV]
MTSSLSDHTFKVEPVSTYENTAENEALLRDLLQKIKPVSDTLRPAANHRLDHLTKPIGSLGKLEELAVRMCCIQNKTLGIAADPLRIYAIAGDHGVNEEGVSAFTQDVTRQMVQNFCDGGAGINVLANTAGAELCVVDLASKGGDYPNHPSLIQCKIAQGTQNIAKAPAMNREMCLRALLIGATLANKALAEGCPAIGTGEMGVSNTTPSTALYCAYLNLHPQDITGAGGGLDPEGVTRKTRVIERALSLHSATIESGDTVDILATLGGYEIAALAGLILGGAANNQLVLLDGFIATAAYTAAWKLCPTIKDYAFFSHASAEAGHKKILAKLDIDPLHDLGLRLGEGSGVPLALFLMRCACNTYNQMTTYSDADVEPPDNL